MSYSLLTRCPIFHGLVFVNDVTTLQVTRRGVSVATTGPTNELNIESVSTFLITRGLHETHK